MLLIHFFTGEKVLPPYLFSTILYSSSSKALLNCCPRMASSNFYFPVSALILYLPIASLFSPAPHPRNFPFRQSQHFPVFLSLEPAPHLCLTNDLYHLFFFLTLFPFILLSTDDVMHSNCVQNSGTIKTQEEVWMSESP